VLGGMCVDRLKNKVIIQVWRKIWQDICYMVTLKQTREERRGGK
jgi:hypothetical protein